jgi:creatinine amidohydrolase
MPSVDDLTDSLELAGLTWPEAQAVLVPDTVVLVPVGAIEAHGPHLPLDTDVIIAREASRRSALLLRSRGRPTILAPPVTYGVSYVGSCFPGTVPVPVAAVTSLLGSVLSELARWGPRRLAIVNAHLEPAHVAALQADVDLARTATGAAIAFPDKRQERWAATLSEDFRRGARHAGSYETSLVLAASPHSVRLDRLRELPPVWVDLPARLRAGARTFAEAGGTEGYFGDPASASAAEGERLFAALAEMIATAVAELDGS